MFEGSSRFRCKSIFSHHIYIPHRWTVHATMDMLFCDASVNFNVPGKHKASSTELLATVWKLRRSLPTGTIEKYAIEFTDVGGSLGSTGVPLNTWVQVDASVVDESVQVDASAVDDSPVKEESAKPAISTRGDASISMFAI